jgi:hypothetical protein
MSNQEKLNVLVKIAQSYILLYLKEYISQEKINDIEILFARCPIIIDSLGTETNEFDKKVELGGIAQSDKIIINKKDIEKTNIDNELELNKMLGTIIHEYAHKIRALNNPYGEMFEESFASIFAEICINNGKIKLSEHLENMEPFEMLDSVNYQKYESQVRALLYVLKQNNLDQKLISEYVVGDQDNFKQICVQIFGNEFNTYFASINSKSNNNSEQLIIELITKYIKEKGLNICDYWKNNNQLNKDNMYFRGSPTLVRAVLNSGINSFSQNDQEFYKYYESINKVDNENVNLINQEKVDRIKQTIEQSFSLKQKKPEDIYDTLIDLCSAYIRHQNKDDEESKIFISELHKIIPTIDDFKNKFINLRVSGKDKNIFDGLDLENITYNDIYLSMNRLLQVDEFGSIKR